MFYTGASAPSGERLYPFRQKMTITEMINSRLKKRKKTKRDRFTSFFCHVILVFVLIAVICPVLFAQEEGNIGETPVGETVVEETTAETGENLADAALGGLESSLKLFQNHPATEAWTLEIEQLIRNALGDLETNPAAANETLRKLADLILREDKLTETLLLQEEGPFLDAPETSYSLYTADKAAIALPKLNEDAPNGETGERNEPSARRMTVHKAEIEQKYGSAQFASDPNADDAPTAEVRGPRTLSQYRPGDRIELLKAFRYQLDRRVYLWTYAAGYTLARDRGALQTGRDLNAAEIESLRAKTEAVRNYFGVSEVGKKWRSGFEVDALFESLERTARLMNQTDEFQPAFGQVDADGVSVLDRRKTLADAQTALRDRINSICSKVRTVEMTESQRKIFGNPILADWVEALEPLVCDQGDVREMILAFEEYERTCGGDAGRRLARCAARLKNSKSEVSRQFGAAVGVIFDNPNIKVYISELFLNRFLPIRDPEFDVVQEVILNNPVAGRRRTDTQVRIKLVPDEERLLMNLYVSGKIVAATRSDVFPAKVFNQSQATYLGRKTVEWKGEKIVCSASEVAVNNSSRLSDVQTDIDFVPLLGELAREVVRGQYQSMQGQIDQETKGKIIREVRSRIDTETKERFDAVNQRLEKNFFKPLADRGLTLALRDSKTTNDWLLASLRLGEPYSLGSQTREPATLAGAFADVKVHESALNTALSRLDLAGKDFTVEGLTLHLAKTLQRPQLAKNDIDDPGFVFGMAVEDPICVSFHENRIQLRLRFDFIEFKNQYWENVEAIISYQPSFDAEGNAYLVRDGLISVDGPLSIRAQIPLRLLFSKAFPAQGAFPLKPKRFQDDERFAGLSIGLCRITEGWFAVSVIQPSSAHQAAIPVPLF